ncbi:MAG TPA: sigma factor-like helix-turn-helix DNA-binding protein, partial [Polyangia bacterium]
EGQTVSSDQLARLLGVPAEDVEHMATRLSGHDVSLDAPRSADDERRQSNLLAIDAPSQEELYADGQEEDSRKAMLHEGLKQLDPRERAILKARHMSARPITLGALGKRFGISRERVRQLELRAVAKLRSYCSGGLIDARHAFHPAGDDGVRVAA